MSQSIKFLLLSFIKKNDSKPRWNSRVSGGLSHLCQPKHKNQTKQSKNTEFTFVKLKAEGAQYFMYCYRDIFKSGSSSHMVSTHNKQIRSYGVQKHGSLERILTLGLDIMWKHWNDYLTSRTLCNFIFKIRITKISTQGFRENETQNMHKISEHKACSVQVIGAQLQHMRLFEDLTHVFCATPKGPGHHISADILCFLLCYLNTFTYVLDS